MLKRRILCAVLTVVLILSFMAFAATAATQVDTGAPVSLSLTYSYDGQPFSGLDIKLYRVATVSQYVDFTLTGSFSQLPVEVNKVKTQEEWQQVASTFSAFVVAEGITADAAGTTGEDGTVSFAALAQGLYLVEGVQAAREKGYCQFDSFMITLPDLDENDDWVYDVVAKPKSAYREVLPEDITYTVNKLWKDEGFAHLRPQNVSIALYRNGEPVETVVLSEENNWTYSWTTQKDGSLWQAVETDVPDGYTVTLEQKDNFFFVTNGYDGYTPPPPTGDITNLRLYILLMCVSGAGLIVLGITYRRGKKV